MCVIVYMCVWCVGVHVCARALVHVHVCVHIRLYSVHRHVCVCVCVCECMCVLVLMRMYVVSDVFVYPPLQCSCVHCSLYNSVQSLNY